MRITLYRLNPGIKFDNTIFRNPGDYKLIATEGISQADIKLYIKHSHVGNPKWVDSLGSIVKNASDLSPLRSASSAAILLAKVDGKSYAVCFGNGFQALQPATYTRGFGVRVAANAIAGTKKIKSADTRGLDRDGRSQKVILPVASDLAALGIEPTEEWVRQIKGSASSSNFALTAEGSDSLKLSIKDFSLLNLGDKLRKIESYWASLDYKKDFGFLDHFSRLDPQDPMVKVLDSELTKLVLAKDTDIYFAEPEPFDRQPTETYRIKYRKKVQLGELIQNQVYDAISALNLPKEDPLKKVTVEAIDANGTCVDSSDLYEYIQAEILKGTDRYVLSAGVWFKVNSSYVSQVSAYLAGVEDLTNQLALPMWEKKKSDPSAYIDEGDYNLQLATTGDYVLLDKKNLSFGQYRRIEVCDLLSTDREMLCVKRASKSSSLSHLFAQGNVSSALMHEQKYQEHVLKAMKTIGGPSDWGSSSDWKIVFAIGTPKPGPLAQSLFFFSQVQLMITVREIRSRNIKVAIARIEQ